VTSPVERLTRLDSCAVSDARDRLGLADTAVIALANLTGTAKIAGRVVTVELGPPRTEPSTRHLCTAAIESAGPGDVIVVAHQGRDDCAAWGGNLSRAARARGVAGTLVHGAARDVDEARTIGYPVYATRATPHTARGRTQELGWNEPIRFADVPVSPGDFVIADGSGTVFVAAGDIGAVLDAAEEIAAAEAAMAEAIEAGKPVSDAMGARYERMTSDRA
jgi:4-hydroxy-4-methyl-2-oxoglutarate aldolase